MIAIENHDFPAAYWLANPNGDFEHSGAVGLGSFNTKKGIDLEIPLGSIPPASSTPNIYCLSATATQLACMVWGKTMTT